MEEPANREETRNADGTYKKGVSGNLSGRPKGTLKDYMRKKFMEMDDTNKEEFLKKIPETEQWRMGEGNPKQDTDITSGGQPIPIYGGTSINVQGHDSNPQDIPTKETD